MTKQILLSFSILLLAFSIASAQENVKTISGGVVNGKATSLPKPEKAAAAEAVNACGSVNVSIVIDTNGDVEKAEAISGHPLLKGTTIAAARQAKFEPTFLSGEAVKISGILIYTFHCNKSEKASTPPSNNLKPITILGDRDVPGDSSGKQTKEISGGVVNGKAISLPKPVYPPEVASSGIGGSVKVQILIDEEGNVISAEAVSGNPLLRPFAEQAALQAKFAPTKLAGQPVKVSGIIAYVFNVPGETAAERTAIMGIGAVLSVSKVLPKEEWDPLTEEDMSDTQELYEILEPLTKITRQTEIKDRLEIIDKVSKELDSTLKGDDAWQFRFGKLFGDMVSDFIKYADNQNEDIDFPAVRTKLLKMNDMLLSAPKDFPPVLLIKFKEMSEIGKSEDFVSEENFTKLGSLVLEVFEIVAPDDDE